MPAKRSAWRTSARSTSCCSITPDGHGIRVVGKRGVRVGNIFYIASELGEFMGQRVQVKLDPLDPAIAVPLSRRPQRIPVRALAG
jgi:hypothetical protein